MKTLCNKIMSLDCGENTRIDYGQMAFLFFIIDKQLIKIKKIAIEQFCIYLFRFYCDNYELAKKHYSKIINNIYLCKPNDLKSNAFENLSIIKNRTNLINYDDQYICWNYKEIDVDYNLLNQVISFVASKYTKTNNFYYTDNLSENDFIINTTTQFGSKLFNRLLERINYCFVCGEEDLKKLEITPISLDKKSLMNIDNYLLLCHFHSKLLCRGDMKIFPNGITMINNKKQNSRLDIHNMKKIRKYLRNINY